MADGYLEGTTRGLPPALDTVYWPEVTREVSKPTVWREVRAKFELVSTLAWLGVEVEDVAKQADHFRLDATFEDVQGDFFDIVRRAKPSAWATLRGPARTAMADRIVGEVLHKVAEEAKPTPPPPKGTLPAPLSHQWLGDRPSSLDAALSDLQPSPFPALVLALEGETEMSLMPLVFDLLGIRLDPSFIRIECFGGTTKDLQLLARSHRLRYSALTEGGSSSWIVLLRTSSCSPTPKTNTRLPKSDASSVVCCWIRLRTPFL